MAKIMLNIINHACSPLNECGYLKSTLEPIEMENSCRRGKTLNMVLSWGAMAGGTTRQDTGTNIMGTTRHYTARALWLDMAGQLFWGAQARHEHCGWRWQGSCLGGHRHGMFIFVSSESKSFILFTDLRRFKLWQVKKFRRMHILEFKIYPKE